MMTYLSVIALFGSRFGGGWLFLFLPTFYVFVVSHTLLLISKNCKRGKTVFLHHWQFGIRFKVRKMRLRRYAFSFTDRPKK